MELTIGDLIDASGAGVVVEPPEADLGALRATTVHAAVLDSRQAAPGDFFVALRGARDDGARFVGDAYARGALSALTSAPPTLSAEQRAARPAGSGNRASSGSGAVAPFVALVTADPLAALQRAAAAWRGRHGGVRVVGVTGSLGKTTTREAIAALLAEAMPVLVSPRSYNNEIGLPLTLLGLEARHRVAVLEMGMYARGEIAELAALAHPHIGVVTMVGPNHLERLGSIEAIAAAKAELIEALPPDGMAVLNGDDPRVRAMADLTPARALFFGRNDDNDWRATELDDRGLDGFGFTLRRGGWSARIETTIIGRHFVHALLAAAAVGEALELPRDEIAAALGHVRIGERQRFLAGPQGRLIIDDAWNASPHSMLAALDVLAAVPRRRVAILGEMLELGVESEPAHRAVGRRAGEVAQALLTIGAGGKLIAEEARRAGLPREAVVAVATPAEVPSALGPLLRSGDGILVKGSRGLRLEETVQWLLDEPSAVSHQASASG